MRYKLEYVNYYGVKEDYLVLEDQEVGSDRFGNYFLVYEFRKIPNIFEILNAILNSDEDEWEIS